MPLRRGPGQARLGRRSWLGRRRAGLPERRGIWIGVGERGKPSRIFDDHYPVMEIDHALLAQPTNHAVDVDSGQSGGLGDQPLG